MDENHVSGGISGAITDIESEEALLHAIKRYEFFRNINYDITNIAKNTGIDARKIFHIKQYLFYLDILENKDGTRTPFEPSFAIAQSWNRLAFEPNNIKPHDLMLLKHELYEMSLVFQGYNQKNAHIKATQKFPYSKMAMKYYQELEKTQTKKHKITPLNYSNMKKISRLIKESTQRLKKLLNKIKSKTNNKKKGR